MSILSVIDRKYVTIGLKIGFFELKYFRYQVTRRMQLGYYNSGIDSWT